MGPDAGRPESDENGLGSQELSAGGTIAAGLGWSVLNSLAARLGTVVLGLVLARVLVPGAYGEFAVALVVLVVAQSMNELGVSVVVLRSGDSGAERTATTIALLSSIAVTAAIVGSAPVVATAVGVPGAAPLVRVMAFGVLVDGLATMPNVMLARRFLQKRRAVADLAGLFGSAAISIPLALVGGGPWCLVAGTLVGNVVSASVVLAVAPERPRPGWSAAEARALIGAGLPLAGTSLLAVGILNLDYVVIGRSLGPSLLGAYLLAFNLASWPVNVLSVAVRRVTVPAFARLAAGGHLTVEVVARSVQVLGALAGVAAVSLATLAGPIVALLYGPAWSEAVGPVRWLALLGAVRVMVDVVDDLLAALGRERDLLAGQLAWFAALCFALPVGARSGGVTGVAAAHCVVAVLVVVPTRLVALRRASLPSGTIIRRVAVPVVAGLVTTVVVALLRPVDRSPLAEVVLLGPLGAVVFTLVIAGAMSVTVDDRRVLCSAGRRLRRGAVRAG